MILVVDNYDSFTWNLVQALRALGATVAVERNDVVSVAAIEALRPRAIVLSPGPGRPEDAGVTPEVVRRLSGRIPILGVCLGHQAIGLAFGARVIQAPAPVHGKPSPVHHRGDGLFTGLASPLTAGRYHSLAIDRTTLPPALRITAETADGTVMAMASDRLPLWGLQFHPESVLTPEGPRLLAAFLALIG